MFDINDWITTWGTVLGVGSLIIFMVFIIWDLSKNTKAGRFGTFVISVALGLGMLGFVIKGVLMVVINDNQV